MGLSESENAKGVSGCILYIQIVGDEISCHNLIWFLKISERSFGQLNAATGRLGIVHVYDGQFHKLLSAQITKQIYQAKLRQSHLLGVAFKPYHLPPQPSSRPPPAAPSLP
jgi:hypothetical protein